MTAKQPLLYSLYLLSLGCPKTLVDSEVILGKLDRRRFCFIPHPEGCDIAMINTCSFIHDAKRESVEKICELIEMKKAGRLGSIVVLGCLVQHFPEALKNQLKEVDAFVGSGDYHKIPEVISRVLQGRKIFSVGESGYLATSSEPRIALTPLYSRYLKISEGCNHACSFCTIPFLRGRHRSRSITDLVKEAKKLVKEGARELILVGQDTSYYGRDRNGKYLLADLLKRLDRIDGIRWIRLLYTYPNGITDELLDTIRRSKHICRSIDMPLQHINDDILRRMKRGINHERTEALIRRMRSKIPGLSIRTTFIVGFPGETECRFKELLDFIQAMKFERLGVFSYSPEKGTLAAKLRGQVPEAVKKRRVQKAMRLQQMISRGLNRREKGRIIKILVEGPVAKRKGVWKGRTYRDAPQIDQTVYVRSKKKLVPGAFYFVKITQTREYDLIGEVHEKNSSMAA